ncbi:MAG: response regulator transcription factor [Bacteroidota bacterium]|uniref:Response regulator transcription factor n=1 Tax=Pedobacter cryotolerans TaxID=2571270 RepID=A0A4U1BZ61_9SPHI|nr:response regulator transcription factor [Pedobacter cryotolerans]TKB98452.1 response regulator transcription factor [Pedobacter cryotolerans]
MKILVIEDEESLRESIVAYLKGEGNICEVAGTYWNAMEKINLYSYDCILLDLTLPGGDGLKILSEIKNLNKTEGVLIISARHSLDDKLSGLEMGADDYLVKPFHLSELKARIMAIVRRKNFSGSNLMSFNEINLDLLAMEVRIKEKLVTFTKKEYDLLIYFISNQGKVITKNAIAEHLWGDEIDMSDDFDFIYTHIKNLRKKLVEAGAKDYIRSMYGVGYKLENV